MPELVENIEPPIIVNIKKIKDTELKVENNDKNLKGLYL